MRGELPKGYKSVSSPVESPEGLRVSFKRAEDEQLVVMDAEDAAHSDVYQLAKRLIDLSEGFRERNHAVSGFFGRLCQLHTQYAGADTDDVLLPAKPPTFSDVSDTAIVSITRRLMSKLPQGARNVLIERGTRVIPVIQELEDAKQRLIDLTPLKKCLDELEALDPEAFSEQYPGSPVNFDDLLEALKVVIAVCEDYQDIPELRAAAQRASRPRFAYAKQTAWLLGAVVLTALALLPWMPLVGPAILQSLQGLAILGSSSFVVAVSVGLAALASYAAVVAVKSVVTQYRVARSEGPLADLPRQGVRQGLMLASALTMTALISLLMFPLAQSPLFSLLTALPTWGQGLVIVFGAGALVAAISAVSAFVQFPTLKAGGTLELAPSGSKDFGGPTPLLADSGSMYASGMPMAASRYSQASHDGVLTGRDFDGEEEAEEGVLGAGGGTS